MYSKIKNRQTMKILSLNQFNEKLKANQISLSDLKDVNIYNYYPKTKDELKQIIEERIENEGPECDLNDIDVSNITDMNGMFYCSKFNGDISKWNVSEVTDMNWMFYDSQFNGDISKWNVRNVKNMERMFASSKLFNGDISKWNVSKVEDMGFMFYNSPLEKNPPKWYNK